MHTTWLLFQGCFFLTYFSGRWILLLTEVPHIIPVCRTDKSRCGPYNTCMKHEVPLHPDGCPLQRCVFAKVMPVTSRVFNSDLLWKQVLWCNLWTYRKYRRPKKGKNQSQVGCQKNILRSVPAARQVRILSLSFPVTEAKSYARCLTSHSILRVRCPAVEESSFSWKWDPRKMSPINSHMKRTKM